MMRDRKRFYSNPGSPIVSVYTPELSDDGILTLVQTGEENLQDYINSFKDEVSIEHIISLCQRGDTSVLAKRQGTYGDFSDVPGSFAEVLQQVINGQNMFDTLPLDVKQKYNNSFEQWFSDIGSPDWYNTMGFKPVEDSDSAAGEVKKDES